MIQCIKKLISFIELLWPEPKTKRKKIRYQEAIFLRWTAHLLHTFLLQEEHLVPGCWKCIRQVSFDLYQCILMLRKQESGTDCQRCYDQSLACREVREFGWLCLFGRMLISFTELHCLLLLLGQYHGGEFSQHFQSRSLTSLYCTTHVPTPLGGCLCACPVDPVIQENQWVTYKTLRFVPLLEKTFILFSAGVITSLYAHLCSVLSHEHSFAWSVLQSTHMKLLRVPLWWTDTV